MSQAQDPAAVGPHAAPRSVTPEVQLAHEFLGALTDLRAPWALLFESYADGRGWSSELRRSVKVAVLRLRTFGAIERSRRRSA